MAGPVPSSLGFGMWSEKTTAKKEVAQSEGQAGVATCKRADYRHHRFLQLHPFTWRDEIVEGSDNSSSKPMVFYCHNKTEGPVPACLKSMGRFGLQHLGSR